MSGAGVIFITENYLLFVSNSYLCARTNEDNRKCKTKITLHGSANGRWAMPSRWSELHEHIREEVAGLDKRLYDIEINPCSTTGFTNVIRIKGKYQARLQVPGDGRGGERKRRQCSLPTTFEKAEDAALYLAWVKTLPRTDWVDGMPPKLTDRKPRTKKPAKPVEPAQAAEPCAEPSMPSAMTMAVPISFPMPHAPFLAASPLPMQPLGYVPPFSFAM